MQDNRFGATPQVAAAADGQAGEASEGIAARSAAPAGSGRQSAAVAGSGTPADTAAGIGPASQPAPNPRGAPAAESAKAFPESWREELAGGDKAFRKTLDRFENPAALAKAYRELTARLSSGDLRATKPPPDGATPEQIAIWRAEHGLPQTAAAYVDGLQLGDGTVTGEAERTLLTSFAEQAFKGRWTADQYNQAVGWYFGMQDRLAAERDQADASFKHQASAELMREWGHDYAINRNAVSQFFDRSFPRDFKDALLTARLPDGRLLANHPTFNKAILEVARSINPSGTVLPNASGGGLSAVESRIAEIEGKYMRAPHGSDLWKSYWTGDAGARMQAEYRSLLAARARQGRAG